MEVSIATINDLLLSDRDMAVFAGDVDVKHTVLGGTLVQNVIVGNGSREGNKTITGHIRRDTLGLWSGWGKGCVCGGWLARRGIYTLME